MDPGDAPLDLQRRGRAALNLTAAHVGELVREIAPLVRGRTIRDVEALPPADLLLVLEGPVLLRLRFSADPNAPRFHLQHARVERHSGPVGPFFRRAARELSGARIAELAQVAGDRIALLEVRESPAAERRALVLELFGRHANLALLGPDDRVVEVLVPPADPTSARLVPGEVWAPPKDALRRIPRDAAADGATAPDLRAVFPPASAPTSAPATSAPLSWIVESALGAQARGAQHDRALRELVARVTRKLAGARRLLVGLEQRRAASAGVERVRQDGELLKANLQLARRGLTELAVEDLFAAGMPVRRIALDPKRTPQENLTRIFERAKKLARASDQVEAEIAIASERVAALEALLARAREPDSDPDALDASAVLEGLLDPVQQSDPRKKKPPPPRLPYRAFVAARGGEVRVGRSARDNDALTFRHARGNDVWLHTAEAPGSHVVLRVEKGAEPDAEDLLDAAHLAVHFSPLRERGRARVHVARQKEVHKPRHAKPGLVTLSGGRILDVRVQPERLARLLRSQRAGATPAGDENAGSKLG